MPTQNAASKESGHFHAVRFYQDSDSLAKLVAEFVGEGFAMGLPGIVIATQEHHGAIVNRLRDRAFDVEQLETRGDLIVLDAHDVLSRFMVDGVPDAALFRRAMTPVIERACRGRTDCVVRAYGEMVDVLWKDGHTMAATRLETLWNQLALTQAFSLLCGYSMGNFYKDAAHEQICSHHTHILSDAGQAVAVN